MRTIVGPKSGTGAGRELHDFVTQTSIRLNSASWRRLNTCLEAIVSYPVLHALEREPNLAVTSS